MRGTVFLFLILAALAAPARDLRRVLPGPRQELSFAGDLFVRAKITAYTSAADECGKSDGITASGEPARDGVVACNFLPFHMRVKIPALFGEKEFIVKDRMSVRKKDFVDIWVETKRAAKKIGKRKNIEVILLGF